MKFGRKTKPRTARNLSRNVSRNAGKSVPKSKLGRLLASLKPSNLKAYWFSRRGAKMALKIVGAGFLFIFLVFLFFAKDLPSPGKINARVGAQTSKFYDRTGETVLYEVYGNKNRNVVEFDQMSEHIKEATVAVEDKDFYKHGAFSLTGIFRAAYVNIFNRSRVQGGSTITQQYVKNALLTGERTFTRKIKELIMAIEIEAFYSKNDILKLYLNEIPYGSNAYGIEAASKTYFNKPAKDLTIDEAALLAAVPKAPTYYSPYGQHTDDLIERKNLILELMQEQKYITEEEAKAAKETNTLAKIPETQNLYASITAPHFVLYVQEQLEDKYGTSVVTEGGLKVITTLDLAKQKAAEAAIAKNIGAIRAAGGSNAAVVSSDPKTGQMLAMVGSYDFNKSQVNVATANRQPGSSFKPFVYSTAWSQNYGPGSTLYDVVTDFGGGYRPTNYTERSYGVLSMRTALSASLNVPAVKTLYLAGIEKSIKTARSMGITTLNAPPGNYGLSLVLGSGEVKLTDMVNAYESFANGGVHYEPTTVLKVTDSKGNVREEFKEAKTPPRVLDPQVAYLMSNVLSDNGARAFLFGNSLVVPGRTVAVKTGTTEYFRDAWTMAYTPSHVVGVWAGNNDNSPMTRSAGAISAPIMRDYILTTLAGTPNEAFVQPAGIKQVTLDAHTGKLATDQSKERRTDVFPSWYKPATAAESRSAKIDKLSGKLATDCTPPLAIETVYASEIHAEIPPSDLAYGRWEPPVQALAARMGYASGGSLPTESDDRHSCSDAKPKVELSKSSLGNGKYRISVDITSGTFTVNKVTIKLADQIVSTGTSDQDYNFDHTFAADGQYTFTAEVVDTGYYAGQDELTFTVNDANSSGGGGGGTGGGVGIGLPLNNQIATYEKIRFGRKR